MQNIELQNLIVQNLLLGLKKQSEAYLDLISNNEYTHDQRKDFEKELSDINKVLNELSGKTINYTVAELEALKNQFNDSLTQLNSIISNLEINTLKIEFDNLTPEQKAFLKGQKGDKGEKGENSYELAVRYGFAGNEIEYLNSLKGKDGKDGVNGVNGINGADGQNGLSAYELAVYNGFSGTLNEWLESLKGVDGQDGDTSFFDFDTLETIQKEKILSYVYQMLDMTSILSRLEDLENNMNDVPFEDNYKNFYEPDNYQQTMSKHNVVYDSTNESQTQLLEHYYMTNLVLVSQQLYKISFVLRFKHYIIESSANVVYDSSHDLFTITEQTPTITLDNYTFNPLINISKLDKKLLVGFSLVDNQTGETPQGLFEFGTHIESNVSFNSVYFEENTEVIDGYNYWVTNQL